jgi:membrane protein required for colicin V production
MAWVDLVFVGIVLLSVLWGAIRGFIREAFSLATWIAAFALALGYGPQFADAFKDDIASPVLRIAAGYAAPFFGVLLIGGLLTWVIGMAVRGAGLAPVDRMLGSGFGLIRGGLIVLILVIVAGFSALGREPWWKQSIIVPQIQPLAKEVQVLIPSRWLAYLQAQQPAPQATQAASVHQREK